MTPSLDDLNPDFLDLLRSLVDAGVEFIVVGAYALSFHGAPRASGDIDEGEAIDEKALQALTRAAVTLKIAAAKGPKPRA